MTQLWVALAGLWGLTRPLNALITAVAVVVGGVITGGRCFIDHPVLLLASLSAALVAAGGNAVNDAFDATVDRINRPRRPIPSGRVGVAAAHIWGSLLLGCGAALGFRLDPGLGLIALSVCALLWGYSAWWKRTPLVGNVVIALCGALALLYGAVAVENVGGGVVAALFAFLIHLGREIVKDCQDLLGDRATGARTLPIAVGERAAQRAAAAVLVILVLLTPLPYLAGIYGAGYLIVVALLADLPLIMVAISLWRGLGLDALGRTSTALKLIMVAGLLALYLG